ncbi:hypothetical protein IJD34_01150 [bacterium]|nr:hypothetical protein [bacterium]
MKINYKSLFNIILGFIFFIGIILRIHVYLLNRSLWHDECSLAINILNGNIFSYFGVLEHLQSAPPIFMIASKALYSMFTAFPESALRFIPLLAGIFSLCFFYVLLKETITNKFIVLIGMFVFSVNFQLIYYAQEFKQYSTDVLMVILALIYYSKYDFCINNLRQKICFAVITTVLPFISLPAIFVIVPALIFNLIKVKKENLKSFLLYCIPFLTLNLIYYFFTLKSSKQQMLSTMSQIWSSGFLSFDFSSNFLILKNNILFCFLPCSWFYLAVILAILGIILLIKRRNKNDILLLSTFGLVIFASFLQIYPIKERVSLYLLPIILIFILSSTEFNFKIKKIQAILVTTVLLVFFSSYNLNYIFSIPKHQIFNRKDSRGVVLTLKEHYKPNEWVIINDASDSDFEFYGKYFNFITPDLKYGRIAMQKYDKDWYFEVLNTLPKGNRYWLCYPYDYVNSPTIPFVKEWILKNAKILYEYEKNSSYLVLIEY